MKISVIIPVYNVEKYLKRCIESVINQTIKDLEIILVDDGSTDSSGKICDEYAKKDKRIKVIHKENGGLSDARNAGLDICTGEFVGFVDSDDYVELNMFECLYNDCIINNCDIVFSNKILELDTGNKKYNVNKIFCSKVENKIGAMRKILLTDPAVCDKLFKKELFKEIRFPVGKLYEDILTTPLLVEKTDKIYFDCRSFYHYIQHDNSIVHSNFTKRKMDYVYNAKFFLNKIEREYKELTEEAKAYYILVLTTILSDIYTSRSEFKQEYGYVLNELNRYKNIYKKNIYIPKSKKIMIFFDLNKMIWLTNIIKKIRRKMLYK